MNTGGTLTIPAFSTTGSVAINVPISAQTLYGSKGFTITVNPTTPTTVASTGNTLIGNEVIANSVKEPTLSIMGFSGTVPAGGTTPFPFNVTLSAASNLTTMVSYATADDTATVAGGDYKSESGMLTFLPGSTTPTTQISVPVTAQNLTSDESFTVNLTSPLNATFPGNVTTETATGNILAFTPSSYSGYAFIDPNETSDPAGASVKTSSETALEGVGIVLTGTSVVNSSQAVSIQAYTAANGYYSFPNLTPGTYVITETMPSGFTGAEAVSGGVVVGSNQIGMTIGSLGGITSTNNNFAFSGARARLPLFVPTRFLIFGRNVWADRYLLEHRSNGGRFARGH